MQACLYMRVAGKGDYLFESENPYILTEPFGPRAPLSSTSSLQVEALRSFGFGSDDLWTGRILSRTASVNLRENAKKVRVRRTETSIEGEGKNLLATV